MDCIAENACSPRCRSKLQFTGFCGVVIVQRNHYSVPHAACSGIRPKIDWRNLADETLAEVPAPNLRYVASS